MQQGPFEWKQAILKPSVQVELTNKSLTRAIKNDVGAVDYTDIEKVYYYEAVVSPFIYSLSLQIETFGGRRWDFGVSRFGASSGHDFEQAKAAIRSFLWYYDNSKPDVSIFDGARPSKIVYWLIPLVLAMVVGQAYYRGSTDSFVEIMILASILLIMSVVLVFKFRKLNRPPEVSARSVFEQLE